jgi:hypothetical protein
MVLFGLAQMLDCADLMGPKLLHIPIRMGCPIMMFFSFFVIAEIEFGLQPWVKKFPIVNKVGFLILKLIHCFVR